MSVGISFDKEVTCHFCAIRSLLIAFACCRVCVLGLSDLFLKFSFFFLLFFLSPSIPGAWRNPLNTRCLGSADGGPGPEPAGGSPSNFCPSLLALHTGTQHFFLTAWFSCSFLLLQKQTLACTASSLSSRVFSPFSPGCGVKAGGSRVALAADASGCFCLFLDWHQHSVSYQHDFLPSRATMQTLTWHGARSTVCNPELVVHYSE